MSIHDRTGRTACLPSLHARRLTIRAVPRYIRGEDMRLAIGLLLAFATVPDDAPDFAGLTWVDARPELRGRVALVRWWTNGCPLCAGSAGPLAELAKKAPVVAVYHPKPRRDVTPEQVRAHAKAIGMPGALAIDRDWAVLD